jgi:hypothetical protein
METGYTIRANMKRKQPISINLLSAEQRRLGTIGRSLCLKSLQPSLLSRSPCSNRIARIIARNYAFAYFAAGFDLVGAKIMGRLKVVLYRANLRLA